MRQRTPSRKPWKVGPNRRLRIVPADVEMPATFRAPHAGGLRFQPRPGAALGTDGVTRAPARRQPSTGSGWPSHHRPPGGRARDNVEGGARHTERLAVDVEHGLKWREPNDSVPRAVSDGLDVVGTKSGPLGREHGETPGKEGATQGWRGGSALLVTGITPDRAYRRP